MRVVVLTVLSAVAMCGVARAQPAAVTATCKDGTDYAGAKRGACRGHGGVQAFGTPTGAAAVPPASSPATPSAPVRSPAAPTPAGGLSATSPTAPLVAPAALPQPQAVPPRAPAGFAAPGPRPALGGTGQGTGQVWVNTRSKVYHCPGDPLYGKTAAGSYLDEAAAKAAGDRPSRGKACS